MTKNDLKNFSTLYYFPYPPPSEASREERDFINNKAGLQPVSRPVERVLGFFPKGFKKGSFIYLF